MKAQNTIQAIRKMTVIKFNESKHNDLKELYIHDWKGEIFPMQFMFIKVISNNGNYTTEKSYMIAIMETGQIKSIELNGRSLDADQIRQFERGNYYL